MVPLLHLSVSMLATGFLTVGLAVQAPPAASTGAATGAPADRWTQFRGSPTLIGTSAATIPDKLRVLWTYEAGEAIESSAAIADGVVYVGAQPGELHAVNLADGKPRWKYKASVEGIGESSPAVAGGLVYFGDLGSIVHAVDAATGQGGVDVQDRRRDQVVAGRRRRSRADRILRLASLRARREGRQAAVEGADRRLRARHAGRGGRGRLHRGLRRDPARDPDQRRQGSLRDLVGRLHRRVAGRSSTGAPTTAPTRTRCWRSI